MRLTMHYGVEMRGPLKLPGLLLACLLPLLLLAVFLPAAASAADTSRAAAAIRHLDAGQPDEFVEQMAALITDGCAKRNLDVDLAVALCYTESNFRVAARNPRTGCAGLFQLAPCHRVADVYNPVVNVEYGLGILADCLKRSNGEIRPALRRYGANTTRTLRIAAMLKSKLDAMPAAPAPAVQNLLAEQEAPDGLASGISSGGEALASRSWHVNGPPERCLNTEALEVY